MNTNNKKQKRILMLGGLRYLIPVIKAAHELGHYVITCDYLPDNIAHKYSDEYHNVSILDKDAVLDLARSLEIDGIMSFAVDPGVTTAYYVAEKLGIPGPSYKSVEILQNKGLFRKFLTEHGFNVPKAKSYKDIDQALGDTEYYTWPVIVKPVDSAGSKGVTKVDKKEDLKNSILVALEVSFSNEFIIEEFITQKGYSSDSDCFSVNGVLNCITFSDQRFDSNALNPYTPAAFSWPATISNASQNELQNELQRLITLLGLNTGIYNIETREGIDGKAYIMEVSPRGGGNRLAEMVRYASGVDLIKNAVRAAVGDEIVDVKQPNYKGYWAIIILHAEEEGHFVKIDANLDKKYIHEFDLWVEVGEKVNGFNGANDSLGTLVLNFETEKEMTSILENQRSWLKIIVE